MKLNPMVFKDGITKGKQVKFGGLNRGLGATDGDLADMRNLTSDHTPLLATRAPRALLDIEDPSGGTETITAIYSHDELCWVRGTGFYYGGELMGTVTPGAKVWASMGDFIIILPDKAYYNVWSGKFGSLESVWTGTSLTFTNGLLFEEPAEANTLQATGVDWNDYFIVGDAVKIEGCTVHPENNKTPVIREIDGNKLYFYEYIFKLNGSESDTPYTETGSLSISRLMPDLTYICENENRLWGCDDRTIYASALGDVFNFNVYEGIDSDAWAVDVGSPGRFTACASYLGHPIFFKEDLIYKVFGTLPSNYEVIQSATLGVAEGCAASLAIAGETLYYLSRAGVVSYSGGIPRTVGSAFGVEKFSDAVGGSDGLKYYISMKREGDGQYRMYVYDTLRGVWHAEDETQATGFTLWSGGMYFLDSAGGIWAQSGVSCEAPGQMEGVFSWFAEFADWTDADPNRKGLGKFQIRLELEPDASVEVFVMFDTDNNWRKVHGAIAPAVKRSYYLPITPRRTDHYRVRLEGTGGCKIFSLTRERYSGSELINE